jgi:hypothetical protein
MRAFPTICDARWSGGFASGTRCIKEAMKRSASNKAISHRTFWSACLEQPIPGVFSVGCLYHATTGC